MSSRLDPLPEAALAAIQDHTVSHVAALALALTDAESFPSLPLPPDVGGLRGFRQAYPRGRNVHLALSIESWSDAACHPKSPMLSPKLKAPIILKLLADLAKWA